MTERSLRITGIVIALILTCWTLPTLLINLLSPYLTYNEYIEGLIGLGVYGATLIGGILSFRSRIGGVIILICGISVFIIWVLVICNIWTGDFIPVVFPIFNPPDTGIFWGGIWPIGLICSGVLIELGWRSSKSI